MQISHKKGGALPSCLSPSAACHSLCHSVPHCAEGGCIINISTLTLIALHVLDVLLCGPTRGSSILKSWEIERLLPCPAHFLACAASPSPCPTLPASCPLLCTPFALHNPRLPPPPLLFGLFYTEGAALATKRSHRWLVPCPCRALMWSPCGSDCAA